MIFCIAIFVRKWHVIPSERNESCMKKTRNNIINDIDVIDADDETTWTKHARSIVSWSRATFNRYTIYSCYMQRTLHNQNKRMSSHHFICTLQLSTINDTFRDVLRRCHCTPRHVCVRDLKQRDLKSKKRFNISSWDRVRLFTHKFGVSYTQKTFRVAIHIANVEERLVDARRKMDEFRTREKGGICWTIIIVGRWRWPVQLYWERSCTYMSEL